MRKELVTQLMRWSGSEKMCMTVASPAADGNVAIRVPGPRLHPQRHPTLGKRFNEARALCFFFGNLERPANKQVDRRFPVLLGQLRRKKEEGSRNGCEATAGLSIKKTSVREPLG